MIIIKVLGPGCSKCKTTFTNVKTALDDLNLQADVEKIEDLQEMLAYNVLTTPVLMINGEAKIKGRVARIDEIKKLLHQYS